MQWYEDCEQVVNKYFFHIRTLFGLCICPGSRTFLQRGSPTPTSLASAAWMLFTELYPFSSPLPCYFTVFSHGWRESLRGISSAKAPGTRMLVSTGRSVRATGVKTPSEETLSTLVMSNLQT